MMMMNTEIKQKWVNALRSNEYAQSTGALKTEYGFCCLGVLCDLYAKEHDDVNWEHRTFEDSRCDKFYLNDESEYLSVDVMKWAGLRYRNPIIHIEYADENDITDEYEIELAKLNDDEVSFTQIANYIEEQL